MTIDIIARSVTLRGLHLGEDQPAIHSTFCTGRQKRRCWNYWGIGKMGQDSDALMLLQIIRSNILELFEMICL